MAGSQRARACPGPSRSAPKTPACAHVARHTPETRLGLRFAYASLFDLLGHLWQRDVLVERDAAALRRGAAQRGRQRLLQELRERIYRYFEEVNKEPLVYRWKYRLEDVDVSEDVIVDTLSLKQSS